VRAGRSRQLFFFTSNHPPLLPRPLPSRSSSYPFLSPPGWAASDPRPSLRARFAGASVDGASSFASLLGVRFDPGARSTSGVAGVEQDRVSRCVQVALVSEIVFIWPVCRSLPVVFLAPFMWGLQGLDSASRCCWSDLPVPRQTWQAEHFWWPSGDLPANRAGAAPVYSLAARDLLLPFLDCPPLKSASSGSTETRLPLALIFGFTLQVSKCWLGRGCRRAETGHRLNLTDASPKR